MSKTVIDLGVNIDIKSSVKAMIDGIDKIEKAAANTDIGKSFGKEIDECKKMVADLQRAWENGLNSKNNNTSKRVLDAFKKDIESRVNAIETRMGDVEKSIKDFQGAVNNFSTSSMAKEIESLRKEMFELKENALDTLNTLETIRKEASKRGSKIEIVDSNQSKQIAEVLKELKELQKKRKELTQEYIGDMQKSFKGIDFSNKANEDVLKYYIDSFRTLQDMLGKMPDPNFDDLLGSKSKESLKMLTDFVEQFDELRFLTLNMGDVLNPSRAKNSIQKESKAVFSALQKNIDSLENGINERISTLLNTGKQKINNVDDFVGDTAKKTTKRLKNDSSNQIIIPIRISRDGSSIFQEVTGIIDNVNKDLQDEPLIVNFELRSKYKMKRRQDALETLEKALKDKVGGEDLQKLINKVGEQWTEDVNMRFKTNLDGNLVEALKTKIKEIEFALRNADFRIRPKIEITDEEIEKIEKAWNEIVDKTALNIGTDQVAKATSNAIDQTLVKSEKVTTAINKAISLIKQDLRSISGTFTKNFTPELDNTVSTTLFDIGQALLKVLEKIQQYNDVVKEMPTIKINADIDPEVLKGLGAILGDGFEISIDDVSYTTLHNQIQTLAQEMKTMFDTGVVKTWSEEFISSIKEVIWALNGIDKNSELADLLLKWNESDRSMANAVSSTSSNHDTFERSALVLKNGDYVGEYDYGGTNAVGIKNTHNGSYRKKQYKKGDILAKIHTHPDTYFASMSAVNLNQDKTDITGDLWSFVADYMSHGIGKQLINTLEQITIFDSKEFFEKYKKIFNDKKILSEFKSIITKKIKEFNPKDYNTASDTFLTKGLESIGVDLREFYKVLTQLILPNITPQELSSIVESLYKKNAINLGTNSTLDALIKSVKAKAPKRKDVIVNDLKIGDDDFMEMLGLKGVSKNQVFGPEVKQRNKMNQIFESASKELSEKHGGKLPIIKNITDLMSHYTHEQFREQNPLNLPTDQLKDLDKIGKNNSINDLATSVNNLFQAVEKLSTINAFDLGFNNEDIDKLAGSMKELTGMMNDMKDGKISADIDLSSVEKMSGSLDSIYNKLSSILTSLNQFSSLFSTAFNVLSVSELDDEFKGIQTWIDGMGDETKNWNFSLNKTKDAFGELIGKYQKYQSQGGKKGFSELFGDTKLADKMQKQYDKQIKSAEESAKAVDKESVSLQEVKFDAQSAAEAKEKFVQANIKVNDSSIESASNIQNESNSLSNIANNRISQIINAIDEYRKAQYELDNLFAYDTRAGFEGFEEQYLGPLSEKVLAKARDDQDYANKITEKYSKRAMSKFDSVVRMFPNIDIDELSQIMYDVGRVFSSVDAAKSLLSGNTKGLYEDVSKTSLDYELNQLKEYDVYKNNSWKNIKGIDPAEDLKSLTKVLNLTSQLGMETNDWETYLKSVNEIIPHIEKAYEEMYGRPYNFSKEQNKTLLDLENEKLTLSDILSLWKELNIQIEKGALLNGDKIASKTIFGDLSNVNFESLNSMTNGIYGKFDTILHSHANGLGTFSPEDTNMVLQNWEQGVRKILLMVDNELHSIDFSSVTREQVESFNNDFSKNFQNAIEESIIKGFDVLNDNKLFSKIKSDTLKPLLKKYGLDLQIDNLSSYIKSTQDSTPKIQQEAESLEKVDKSAREAGQSKEQFNLANEHLRKGAEDSIPHIEGETKALLELIEKMLSLAGVKFDSIKEFSDALNKFIDEFADTSNIEKFLSTIKSFVSYFSNKNIDEKIEKVTNSLRELSDAMKTFQIGDVEYIDKLWKIVKNAKNLEKFKHVPKDTQNDLNNTNKAVPEPISHLDQAWDEVTDKANQYVHILGDVIKIERELDNKGNEIFRAYGTSGEKFGISREQNGVTVKQTKLPPKGYEERQKSLTNMVDVFKKSISGKTFVDDYNNKLDILNGNLKEYQEIVKHAKQGIITDDEVVKANILDKQIQMLIKDYQKLSKSSDYLSGYEKAQKLYTQVTKTMSLKSGMPNDLKNSFEVVKQSLANVGVNTTLTEVRELESEVDILNKKLAESGTIGRGLFDKIKISLKSQISQQVAMWFSVYDFIRYGRYFIDSVKEMDTALTEMRKVSDESIETLREYQTETFKTADAIGATGLQLQQSTADWLRLGESFEQAKESAKDATILFNVSEFESIDQATESLVSMSQAYKDLDKMEIIDVMNNVGNNFSISTDQLSMALQNAAAVLQTQGNDLYKATALITAGNAITQDYSKTAGRQHCLDIWKHILLNIFNCKVYLKLYATI